MENQWISVKDELPKEEEQYLLLTSEIGYYRIGEYDSDLEMFIDLDDYPIDAEYWMPLPKPPTK